MPLKVSPVNCPTVSSPRRLRSEDVQSHPLLVRGVHSGAVYLAYRSDVGKNVVAAQVLTKGNGDRDVGLLFPLQDPSLLEILSPHESVTVTLSNAS